MTAGFEGAGFDEAVDGLGGGLTGLCSVLGILGGTGAAVVGFCRIVVEEPLVAWPLAVLPAEMVTGGFVSIPPDSFLFLLAPCSDTATAWGLSSWEKMQWIMLHLSPSGHGMPLKRPVVENMVFQWMRETRADGLLSERI